jgi:hypothetical protein
MGSEQTAFTATQVGAVGRCVGEMDGRGVGARVVGFREGNFEGCEVGNSVGKADGCEVGCLVGAVDGENVAGHNADTTCCRTLSKSCVPEETLNQFCAATMGNGGLVMSPHCSGLAFSYRNPCSFAGDVGPHTWYSAVGFPRK